MSARDGVSAGKLAEIRRDENETTFLTNVGPDFYQEVRKTLSSMRSARDGMEEGVIREDYTKNIQDAVRVAKDIVARRTEKLMDMAMRDVFKGDDPDLRQATQSEKDLYSEVRRVIAAHRGKAI